MTPDFRGILITGGSSGIGAALARAYAAPDVHIALTGRNAARLEDTAHACEAHGAVVTRHVVDVTDAEAMAALIAEVDAIRPLDLVIANAGISAGTGGGSETAEQTRRIFAVNVDGVLNTLLPAIALMRGRGHGHLAIVSSIAGFRGFGSAPAYCASKAAVKAWGEGLRGWLSRHGIGVSVIMPGFIRTPMTAVNDFPMPFILEADAAARRIQRGIRRNKGRIAFPLPLVFLAWLAASLPDAVVDRLTRHLPGK